MTEKSLWASFVMVAQVRARDRPLNRDRHIKCKICQSLYSSHKFATIPCLVLLRKPMGIGLVLPQMTTQL